MHGVSAGTRSPAASTSSRRSRTRRPQFERLELGCLVVRELMRCDTEGRAQTLAWIVMPDHLHWLARAGRHTDLAARAADREPQRAGGQRASTDRGTGPATGLSRSRPVPGRGRTGGGAVCHYQSGARAIGNAHRRVSAVGCGVVVDGGRRSQLAGEYAPSPPDKRNAHRKGGPFCLLAGGLGLRAPSVGRVPRTRCARSGSLSCDPVEPPGSHPSIPRQAKRPTARVGLFACWLGD